MTSRPDEPSDDFIAELRIRQWARRNYLPPHQRDAALHPIARDEMEFRDRELRDERPEWTMVRTPFVPLLPADAVQIDGPHAAVPAPRSLAGLPQSLLDAVRSVQ
jgi:hypothetical protein